MRKILILAAITFGLMASTAMAQTPSGQPTFEVKQSYVAGTAGTPLATLKLTTLTAASTISSGDITNFSGRGAYCTWFQLAHTGTPSVTLALQAKDAAGRYSTFAITAATTTTDGTTGTTQASLLVYPGAALITTPTGMVGNGIPLPAKFRVQLVIAGTSTPTVTGDVSCVTIP